MFAIMEGIESDKQWLTVWILFVEHIVNEKSILQKF